MNPLLRILHWSVNAARDWLHGAVRENLIQNISAAALPMQWMVLLVEIGAENGFKM